MHFCFIVEELYRHELMPMVIAHQLTQWGHEVDLLEPHMTITSLAEVAGARYDAYVLKTVSDGPGLSLLEAAEAAGAPTINHSRAIRLVRDKAVATARLPYGCLTPHGMDLDTAQHIAFIACIDANPPALIRFNLQTLQTIAEPLWPTAIKPDMVVFDQPLGVVYVGCGAGISLFQEHAMSFKWLATYTYGMSTHTLAVNEQTQEMYLPLPREGGRPVLRILHFNLSGT